MQTAIRISFRQNAEYLMEGQNEATRHGQRNPTIPFCVWNIIMGGTMAAGIILFAVDECRRGERTTPMVFFSIIGCLVIMAGWFWLFRKIGLLKRITCIYEFTDKEFPRYQKYHPELADVNEMDMSWDFNETGGNLVAQSNPASGYAWEAVSKTVEVETGFLMFVRRKGLFSLPVYLWFHKSAFNSGHDHEAFRELARRKAVPFETCGITLPSGHPPH